MTHIDIDLRGTPGDVRYSCDVCGWGVTLKPEGERMWTQDRTIEPRCRKDDRPLTRRVYQADGSLREAR